MIVLPSLLVSSLRLRLYILPAGIEQKIGKSKDVDYNIDNDSVVYDSNKIWKNIKAGSEGKRIKCQIKFIKI